MRLPFRRRSRELVCRQAVDLMAAYLDDALPPDDRVRLEVHLGGCPHCTEYLAQLRVVIEMSGEVGPDDLDDAALDELVDLYRTWRSS
jgi:anti-sigma factor RsiW